jgi:hypothetical protein
MDPHPLPVQSIMAISTGIAKEDGRLESVRGYRLPDA